MNQASAYCAFNNRLCRRKKIREDIIWKPIKSWSSSNPALLFLGQFPAHLPRRSPVRHAKFWPLRLPWSTRFCLAERCPLAVLRYASVQFQPQKRITKKKEVYRERKKNGLRTQETERYQRGPISRSGPIKDGLHDPKQESKPSAMTKLDAAVTHGVLSGDGRQPIIRSPNQRLAAISSDSRSASRRWPICCCDFGGRISTSSRSASRLSTVFRVFFPFRFV